MTDRFLAGLHPTLGTMGVWLSYPGVDVKTATLDSQYLLRPETKNDQVVLSGSIFIAIGGAPVTISYPITFAKIPYVFFHAYTSSGAASYPYDLNLAATQYTVGGVTVHDTYGGMSLFSNGFQFSNPNPNWDLYLDYHVYNRSIGT